MNKIILIGRLAQDPELRYTAEGVAVAGFALAVDRPFSETKEVDFIKIVAWRKTAENAAEYLKKGNRTAVEGRLQMRKYENKEGENKIVAEVVAEKIEFLESKKETATIKPIPPVPPAKKKPTTVTDDDNPFY